MLKGGEEKKKHFSLKRKCLNSTVNTQVRETPVYLNTEQAVKRSA